MKHNFSVIQEEGDFFNLKCEAFLEYMADEGRDAWDEFTISLGSVPWIESISEYDTFHDKYTGAEIGGGDGIVIVWHCKEIYCKVFVPDGEITKANCIRATMHL